MASPKTHRLRSPVLEFPCSRAVRFVWPRILGFQGSWIEFRRLRWVRVQTRKESPAGVGVGGHFGSVNSRWLGKVSPRSFRETYRGETEAGPDDPTTWRKWGLGGLLPMTRSLLAKNSFSEVVPQELRAMFWSTNIRPYKQYKIHTSNPTMSS